MNRSAPATALRGREVWRELNARPGWRISLRRVYVLLESGEIPSVALHGAWNTHYTVSREELVRWAESIESRR
jgi:hypothetical protein